MNTIDEICQRDGRVTSSALAEALGVSRQAAHRKLVAAVESGDLRAVGRGRGRHYVPVVPTFRFAIEQAAEDEIYRFVETRFEAELEQLGGVVRSTLGYAFTEMVNNAIEHSRGSQVEVRLSVSSSGLLLVVEDDGIGVFESVRRTTGLEQLVESAAELTKGKVTSMPERHTGEGIFFTSRAADRFCIRGNGLELVRDNELDDVAIRECEHEVGTRVELSVGDPPIHSLQQVFEAHQHGFEFAKTRTVVKLFGLGRDFVSRSEARRLLQGLEAFREVVVDFEDVRGIGQGFADEVFRVWANRHPEIRLVPVNMVAPVRFFVERAERARG